MKGQLSRLMHARRASSSPAGPHLRHPEPELFGRLVGGWLARSSSQQHYNPVQREHFLQSAAAALATIATAAAIASIATGAGDHFAPSCRRRAAAAPPALVLAAVARLCEKLTPVRLAPLLISPIKMRPLEMALRNKRPAAPFAFPSSRAWRRLISRTAAAAKNNRAERLERRSRPKSSRPLLVSAAFCMLLPN
jgi:hypothetical protein